MRDYTSLKTELENRNTVLNQRLQRIKHDITRGHSHDWSEQAQERENDEVLNQLGHTIVVEIREIDAALQRLQNGSYGHCLSCGIPIIMPRLKIKPETAFCTGCADHE